MYYLCQLVTLSIMCYNLVWYFSSREIIFLLSLWVHISITFTKTVVWCFSSSHYRYLFAQLLSRAAESELKGILRNILGQIFQSQMGTQRVKTHDGAMCTHCSTQLNSKGINCSINSSPDKKFVLLDKRLHSKVDRNSSDRDHVT
jgi:hypothetical protein